MRSKNRRSGRALAAQNGLTILTGTIYSDLFDGWRLSLVLCNWQSIRNASSRSEASDEN